MTILRKAHAVWKKRGKIKKRLIREFQQRVHGAARLSVTKARFVKESMCFPLAPALYQPERNTEQQRDDFNVLLLPKGRVWPSTSSVAVSGSFVLETLLNQEIGEGEYASSWIRDYPAVHYNGAVTTIGHIFVNYYNRIIESILRLYSLNHPDLAGKAITVLIDDRFTSDEKNFIQHLIPDSVTLDQVMPYNTFIADECIHLPRLCNKHSSKKSVITSPGFAPFEALDWLRAGGLQFARQRESRHFEEKIFVTRPVSAKRNITNLPQVESYLSDRGFEIVNPARMSLSEQINCFAGAKVVVAQHGAALTNLVFSEQVKVIELHAPDSSHYPFRELCNVRGFPYASVTLDNPEGGVSRRQREMPPKDRDGFLPLSALQAALDEIETT